MQEDRACSGRPLSAHGSTPPPPCTGARCIGTPAVSCCVVLWCPMPYVWLRSCGSAEVMRD